MISWRVTLNYWYKIKYIVLISSYRVTRFINEVNECAHSKIMVIGGSLFYSIHSFRFGYRRSLKFIEYEWFMSVTHWLIGGYSWLFVQIVNIWGSARKWKIVYHYPHCIMKHSCHVTLEMCVKGRYLNGTSISSMSDYRLRCMDS